MSSLGFNSGMSDALQKIMESRLKQQQQQFENDLKLKEESRLAEEHAANMELHREQLAQAKQQKADAAAEKLQKNLGAGSETTAKQDKALSDAGLPVSGGITLPSTQFGGMAGPMAAVAPPDLSADTPPEAPLAVAPAAGPGKLTTQYHPPVDQRTLPPQTYNPVTGSGARVPTLNTGSAADRLAVSQRKAITDSAGQLYGFGSSSANAMADLVAGGVDVKDAAAMVKASQEKTGAHATQAESLYNPANKNAVMWNPEGPQGAGYYDTSTHAFVPSPAHYSASSPELQGIKLELERARLEAAKNNLPDAADFVITPGSHDDKIAAKLATGDLQLSDFYALFGRAAGGSAKRREAVLLSAMEKNPNFNPAEFKLGFQFAGNAKNRQQVSSLNNVESSIPDLLSASDAAARTNVPLLNDFVIKGGYMMGGHKYADLKVARTAFADELSGALGYGSATDMSRQMGFDMTDPNLSPDAFTETIKTVVLPFIARKRANLLGPMGVYTKGLSQPGAPPSGTLNTTAPTAPTAIPSNVTITRTK